MNTIETNLARASSKWKWQRFIELVGIAGCAVTLLVLLLGVALDRLWITSRTLAYILLGFLVFCAIIGSVLILVLSLSRTVERTFLAERLETDEPKLQDRLNTLVFIEQLRSSASSVLSWFYPRIAAQAADLLAERRPRISFPWTRALSANALFLTLVVGTLHFYDSRRPWQTLRANETSVPSNSSDKPLELALPGTNMLEETGDWGEMRITDPAKDLRITKVDTVQLQIEAAANRALTNSTWYSTVNGHGEQAHPLPPPAEPKFAAYQPIIYADEFNLKDWDVMTYYAQARSDRGTTYGSEVYFLEVRPFREDIAKMAGGEGGAAYKTLGQLTDLITRQQHVIRETHRYVQSPPKVDRLQEQDRGKLADAEKDLSEAAWHLYSEIAVDMENKPIGAALDQLGLAQKTLLQASGSLRLDQINPAKDQERLALRQLVDTRKLFQKAVSDHPDDFNDKPQDDDKTPIAETSKDKLNEMAEFRNEEKATRDFVDKLLKQEQNLAQEAAKAGSRAQTNLAARQRDLKTQLDQFSAQHPQMFKNASNELVQASDAMQKSSVSLDKRNNGTRNEPQTAVQKTEELSNALSAETIGRQLTSAYHLKKMLDQQIDRLDQANQNPGGGNQDELDKTAGQAKETTRQLKQITEQKPTGEMFGPGLGSALGDDKKRELDKELDQLGQTKDPQARHQLASKATQDLRQISKAFEESQPKALQQAKGHDALKEPNALEKGMDQLQRLLARLQGDRPLSEQDLQKLAREAELNVRDGLTQEAQTNEAAKKLLLTLEEDIRKTDKKIDLAGIRKLVNDLESLTTEVKDPAQKTNEPAATSVDTSKLPAAYRGRIEKYFRKLSETK